jgi:hypothetical protein
MEASVYWRRSGTNPILAVVGSISWFAGFLAATIVLRRPKASLVPVCVLVVSGLGVSVFKTHAWPGGPISFGALAVEAAWLEVKDRSLLER